MNTLDAEARNAQDAHTRKFPLSLISRIRVERADSSRAAAEREAATGDTDSEFTMNAAPLREETAFDPIAPIASRDEVLERYRRLRVISIGHNKEMVAFLTKDAIVQQVRRLGLLEGKTIVLDSMDQLNLAADLAIYSAPADRSRAIDRYAHSRRWAPGSEEAIMLEVMREARFAIIKIERRHPSVGLIVKDLFCDIELWLVDEGLEKTAPPGMGFALRYFSPGPFDMSAGVGMPVGRDTLERALNSAPYLTRKSRAEAVQDRRFAEAVYRTAIKDGTMENIRFVDPLGEGDDE